MAVRIWRLRKRGGTGVWQISPDLVSNISESDSITFLTSNEIALNKRSYSITINYEADEDQSFTIVSNHALENKFIQSQDQTVTLNNTLNDETYQFNIDENLKQFIIIINYSGQGNFTINNVYLTTNDNFYKRGFVYLLIFYFILDYIIFIIQSKKEKKILGLSLITITLLISLPLFFDGLMHGDDLNFHLLRIEAIVHELRLRHFPIRISSLYFGGYGYPVSIMYGDWLLYFPAALRLLGMPLYKAYEIYEFFINFATVLSSIICFRKIFKSDKIGIILSFIYCTCPYQIVSKYQTGFVGEYPTYIFYPIIALAMFEIYSNKNKGIKKNIKNATILAIGMSAMITTHILSTEIAVISLVIIALCFYDKTFTLNSLRTIGIGIIETVLFSASFLIPMLDYYSKDCLSISAISKYGDPLEIQNVGLSIGDYFTIFSNDHIITVGLPMIFIVFLGIFSWVKKKATRNIKIFTVLSIFFLFLATRNFPWNYLGYHFKFFNILAQVQFPRRYLNIASIIITILLGLLLKENIFETLFENRGKIYLNLILLFSLIYIFSFNGFVDENSSRDHYADTFNISIDNVIFGEYVRTYYDSNIKGYIHALPEHYQGQYYPNNLENFYLINRDGTNMDFYVKSNSNDSDIQLPIVNYPYYQVTDDKGNNYEIEDGADCIIRVLIPKGFDGNLHLRFVAPWFWKLADIISLISILLLFVSYIFFSVKEKNTLN